MKYYKVIFIIIIIIYLYYYLKSTYFNKHSYWDSQPVSRKYSKNGNLTRDLPKALLSKEFIIKGYDINNNSIFTHIQKHINTQFIKNYHYKLEYLRWSCSEKLMHNLALLDKNNSIIGTISVKPTNLVVNYKMLNTGYVDYLAINQNYRNKRLAPVLISNLIAKNNFKTYIFKIETKPLPFDYMCKYRYYVYDLEKETFSTTNRFDDLQLSEINDTYDYYSSKSKHYKLYQQYDLSSFKKMFYHKNKEVINTLIGKDTNGNINCFICYFITDFKHNGNLLKIAEIICYLSDNIVEDIKTIITRLQKSNLKYLITTNLGRNSIFIDRLHFFPGKRAYLQMYNYGLNTILHPSEVMFNLP